MIRKYYILSLYLFFTIIATHAQEIITPLQNNPLLNNNRRFQPGDLGKNEADTPAITNVKLPFFDDFSRPELNPGDKGPWIDNFTYVNTTMGFKPPSTGVVTFDGLDWRGIPYNMFGSGNASADTLTSSYVDLTPLPNDTADTTIYLSFFYQAQGLGEVPDAGDSLVLEFHSQGQDWTDTLGIVHPVWIRQWGIDGGSSRNPFALVMVPIRYNKDTNYFYNQFQFRFRNLANPSGNLDVWNIDYIYIDRGRTAKDTAFNDIAIYKPSGSILKDYYSMPWSQFISSPSKHLITSVPIYAKNNFNQTKNVYLGYKIVETSSQTIIDSQLQLQGQNLGAFRDTTFFLTPNLSKISSVTPANRDSVNFEVRTIAGSNTGIQPPQYQKNDTAIFTQHFGTYLAYDDGTAEGGYSLYNTVNGKIALRFSLDKPDSLFGIGIHFNQSVVDASLKNFTLAVWNNISVNGTDNDKPIATIDLTNPAYNPWLNDFIYFPFSKPVAVKNQFYIGWIQTQDFQINIGYDANYSEISKKAVNPNLFYDVNGSWAASILPGTPMIRAYIGRTPTAIKEPHHDELNVNIYPNPAHGQFTVALPATGSYDLFMYDMTGNEVMHTGNLQGMANIDAGRFTKGMYFIRLQETHGNGFVSRKIVLE